ncbi:SDR family oxidoreductase [Candidatus Ichthyocystis hellenicum]|uniref:SDR family oxidoreductase n=1 Tax=Candidatus Ichthyocystis hellenicum TaxID=1561003 RepID=UPI000A674183|nr:SDR family oxidoreductase [Candidatus Ichthyocystis hellenicum]
MNKNVVIFGLGYVAEALSKDLVKLGWNVYVTSRSAGSCKLDALKRYSTIGFDSPDLPYIIESAHVIISTIPPSGGIDPVLDNYTTNVCSGRFEWVGYLSSTSVYGDHQGEWVDETSQCVPNYINAEVRLLAERKWLDLYSKYGVPVHIMRLAGIYGPGRNCLEQIKKGKSFTIVKNGHYFSRIHVSDICQSIIVSISSPTPGEIYNVADSEPAPLDVVQQYGAKILNFPELRRVNFEDADISENMRNFFLSNKKVRNHKILRILNINWIYPNYRVGLLEGCLSIKNDK